MCGIVGLIQRQQPIDQKILLRMRETLTRRGPDDANCWIDHNVGLAHRRLSILDLSAAGRQPMFNENKTVAVTYNGEIYNAAAWRQKLQNTHQFLSQTDTEVLVHLYEEVGAELCGHLEGMFAFGLYDKPKQLLTLARDRFGEKPLYYVHTPQIFAFASEPKALYEHPSIRAALRLDRAALSKYFIYGFIPAPHCLTAPLKKLPAATLLQFDVRRWHVIRQKLYWDLPAETTFDRGVEPPHLAQAAAQVDQLVAKAVAQRLAADVPVGIFLSGGLDSSLIAANVVRAGRQLTTFTIAAENPSMDESLLATQVARHLNVPHHVVRLNQADIQTACLDMINYLDEPLADAALFYTYWLARQARREVTVALSGDGGDELFAGYIKHRAQHLAEKLGPLRHLPGLGSLARISRKYTPHLATFLSALPLSFSARQYLWGSGSPTLAQLEQLLPRQTWNTARLFADTERLRQQAGTRDPINTSLYLDSRILLPDGYLAKTDRATMAASLELRSPFLDTNLVETVTRWPSQLKAKGKQGKLILRQIAKRLLPEQALTHKKMGFGVPFDTWLRGPVRNLFQDLITDTTLTDIVDRTAVHQLWAEHQAGTHNHQFTLLRLGMLAGALRRLPSHTLN